MNRSFIYFRDQYRRLKLFEIIATVCAFLFRCNDSANARHFLNVGIKLLLSKTFVSNAFESNFFAPSNNCSLIEQRRSEQSKSFIERHIGVGGERVAKQRERRSCHQLFAAAADSDLQVSHNLKNCVSHKGFGNRNFLSSNKQHLSEKVLLY